MIHGLLREPATAAYSQLAAAEIPALFVGAAHDGSSAAIERLRRLVPQSEIVQLAATSHDLLVDDPGGVTRTVGDWLAR